MKDRLICVAQVLSAHGVKGEVKLRSFTLDPADLSRYAPFCDEKATREFTPRLRGGTGDVFIAAFSGVADRTAAEKLKGLRLFAPAARRPKAEKGRFYLDDLKGLAAVDEKGVEVGRVTEVMNFGAGDILAVENESGREWLLPFKKPYAGKPDMEKGRIEVNIPPDFPFSEKRKPKPEARGQKKKRNHVTPAQAGVQSRKT